MLREKKFRDFAILEDLRTTDQREIRWGQPAISDHYIDLPDTRLHYIKCGSGPPLVMVPATISQIENWQSLAEFMGQAYTVYFFELPGHGKSTPYSRPFSTELVAETVEAFIDRLGYDKVSVIGFSFGGILAMKTLYRLQDRVERMILFAPAATNRALSFSRVRRKLLRWVTWFLENPVIRTGFLKLIHSPRSSTIIAAIMTRVCKIEEGVSMELVFQKIRATTCEVLAYQMGETLDLELPEPKTPFQQPCFFAMSVNDPLLDFNTTLEVIERQFAQVEVERLDFPYHQPPEPLSFEDYNRDYGHFLEGIGEQAGSHKKTLSPRIEKIPHLKAGRGWASSVEGQARCDPPET